MPNISEKKELLAARVAMAVAVILAGIAGILKIGFVAEVVALAFGLAAASFFPAIFLGIFYKRLNKQGAIAGMLCGVVFTAIYIWYFKEKLGGPGTAESYWFGIPPEGIGVLGMIINFIVSIVVSKFTPAPPDEVQAMVEDIRIPKGAGEATGH